MIAHPLLFSLLKEYKVVVAHFDLQFINFFFFGGGGGGGGLGYYCINPPPQNLFSVNFFLFGVGETFFKFFFFFFLFFAVFFSGAVPVRLLSV